LKARNPHTSGSLDADTAVHRFPMNLGGFDLQEISNAQQPRFVALGIFLFGEEMNDSEILTLVARLERCLLSATEFHHRDHITVATVYLYAAEFDPALDRMRTSLLRFVAHHGGSRYHETMTRFWMLQVDRLLDRSLCLEAAVEWVTNALANKNLIYEYYSRERLHSAEAKEQWVEADLRELNLSLS
jgi:hypothetical protein